VEQKYFQFPSFLEDRSRRLTGEAFEEAEFFYHTLSAGRGIGVPFNVSH